MLSSAVRAVASTHRLARVQPMGGGGLPLSHLAPTSTPVGAKSGCSPLSFYEGADLLCVASPPHL
jgi:hypothetical protein